jgi:ABC-2 type transport system ATP-binding protein
MIQVKELTKTYGETKAVDNISFTVQPGVVTGFLGPNGAGKSTTMRMILGLDKPTRGEVLINNAHYVDSNTPLSLLGSLLEAKSVDKGRSAYNHLLAVGATMGIGKKRVNEVIELVGLESVKNRNAAKFSLGMSQRLGIATALLGDPEILILDEPVNGLDPDGILWIRNLLKDLAQEGRTIFLSSHLMSEMELTAEHLIVIGKGKILADMSMHEFISRSSQNYVQIVTPQAKTFAGVLAASGAVIRAQDANSIEVAEITSATVGDLALKNQVVLHQLTDMAPSLESAFMELTEDQVSFHGHVAEDKK